MISVALCAVRELEDDDAAAFVLDPGHMPEVHDNGTRILCYHGSPHSFSDWLLAGRMRAMCQVGGATGPEGLEPPTPGFGDRCSTN